MCFASAPPSRHGGQSSGVRGRNRRKSFGRRAATASWDRLQIPGGSRYGRSVGRMGKGYDQWHLPAGYRPPTLRCYPCGLNPDRTTCFICSWVRDDWQCGQGMARLPSAQHSPEDSRGDGRSSAAHWNLTQPSTRQRTRPWGRRTGYLAVEAHYLIMFAYQQLVRSRDCLRAVQPAAATFQG